jgi:Flp pilus assembly protein TadD
MLLLLTGEQDRYHAAVTKAVALYEKQPGPDEAYRLARMMTLVDLDAEVAQRAIAYALRATDSARKPWSLHVLGVALHRAGRHDEAIQQLGEANGPAWHRLGNGLNHLAMALAWQSLGKLDEARWELQTGIGLAPANGIGQGPADWIEFELLRREAERRISGKSAP